MNKVFKHFALGAAITISMAACSGNKTGGSADSSKVDSSSSTKSTTDTMIKTDAAKRDTISAAADTPNVKIDTVWRTVTKKTIITKTVVKKP